jgi:hypothetical protein
MGIVWLATYTGSATALAEMESFQDATMLAYEYTIDRTESVVIDATATREGAFTDFAYQEQGVATSERIKELRNTISSYNTQLYQYRLKNTWHVIDGMYKDIPEYLKPIILER